MKHKLKFSVDSLTINFVSAKEISEINQKYLNHNYSTDIITFNYNIDSAGLDGEIFISTEDAKANAEKFKTTFHNEMIRLIIHGILHLLGYDDVKKNDKLKMKRIENQLVLELSSKRSIK
ncbi:MAG: rRNA maturation RNase YbeY [Ignavibacteriaceae bacterium]|nr:rRNA maturation RNase YbeY [Ignavibacteriaceae bacterium]